MFTQCWCWCLVQRTPYHYTHHFIPLFLISHVRHESHHTTAYGRQYNNATQPAIQTHIRIIHNTLLERSWACLFVCVLYIFRTFFKTHKKKLYAWIRAEYRRPTGSESNDWIRIETKKKSKMLVNLRVRASVSAGHSGNSNIFLCMPQTQCTHTDRDNTFVYEILCIKSVRRSVAAEMIVVSCILPVQRISNNN